MRALIGPLVIIGLVVGVWMLLNRTPGGISEARYTRYQALAAPKVLYSCTRKPTKEALLRQARECASSGRSGCEQNAYDAGEKEVQTLVEFAGGNGTPYDELVRAAKQNCEKGKDGFESGGFKVLEYVKQ